MNSFGSPKPKNDSRRRLNNAVEPISTATSATSISGAAPTTSEYEGATYLTISNVTVRVPDSDRVLIQDLSFDFKRGKLDLS